MTSSCRIMYYVQEVRLACHAQRAQILMFNKERVNVIINLHLDVQLRSNCSGYSYD